MHQIHREDMRVLSLIAHATCLIGRWLAQFGKSVFMVMVRCSFHIFRNGGCVDVIADVLVEESVAEPALMR